MLWSKRFAPSVLPTSCWVIVEPPCTTSPARAFSIIARISEDQSSAPCSKKSESSIASTARCATGAIA